MFKLLGPKMSEKWHHRVNEYTILNPERHNGKKFYCVVTDLHDMWAYTTRDHATKEAAITDADDWCVAQAPTEERKF